MTKVLAELLFGFIWAGESGGISTDDGYMMHPVQCNMQLHEVLIDSEGRKGVSFTRPVLMVIPTLCSLSSYAGFPHQRKV